MDRLPSRIGITTQEGRVLDRGTGLSQSTVVLALRGLLGKNVIVATRRRRGLL